MNNEENKKSLENFSNDAVDGNNVKGGFGGVGPMHPPTPHDFQPRGPIEGDPMHPQDPGGTGVGGNDPLAGQGDPLAQNPGDDLLLPG